MGRTNRNAMANWFLPLIHFDIDSYKVRFVDYASLSSIAKMMTAEPTLRIVVKGFTDKTSSKDYNDDLSYKRAKAAIDLLVSNHDIDRNRLVLQYNGEDEPLVPSTGSSLMNRRVEFRVANPDDKEMLPPPPVPLKKSKRKGY
jgi:outer membrane protein OmpA-like peptidoglycan-associated protein